MVVSIGVGREYESALVLMCLLVGFRLSGVLNLLKI